MTLESLPECEHRRPHVEQSLHGCRVRGVCTAAECAVCVDRPGYQRPDARVQLLHKPQIIGKGYHRSGWPFVYQTLRAFHDATAELLLDDFVEQTWIYSSRSEPIDRPWVGMFHHPPNPPRWLPVNDRIDALPENAAFRESCRQLQLAICLSEYSADWIQNTWNVPAAVVKHPTAFDAPQFDFDTWDSDRRLLQVGWYLRNTQLIFSIPTDMQRTRVLLDRHAQQRHDAACAANLDRLTHDPSDVLCVPWVQPDAYDWLLSRSVVCVELLDASANNVTLECIARATPLIVNRHPAAVEYLGEDYPLFYDDWTQIAELLHDSERIKAAHEYLQAMDTDDLTAESFSQQLDRVLQEVLA